VEEAQKRLSDSTNGNRDSLKSVLDGALYQMPDDETKKPPKKKKVVKDEDDEDEEGKGVKKFTELTPEERATLESMSQFGLLNQSNCRS
jgi:hypothetical protein